VDSHPDQEDDDRLIDRRRLPAPLDVVGGLG
jgi:hypothetical protein